MHLKRMIILLVLLIGLLIDWSNIIHSKVNYENIITMTIDGFEKPGEWILKFSKFRSKNWDNDVKKEFEDPNKWLKWLKVEDKSPLRAEEILPDGVQKNMTLKETEKTILSIKGKWDFPGFNWLMIEPSNVRPAKQALTDWLRLVAKDNTYFPRRLDWSKENHPNFIWLSGKAKELLIYVWGGNFDFNIEAHVQDFKGNDFILPMGNLNYKGWRNLKIPLPYNLRQSRHSVPNTQPVKFLRFKVYSDPKVDPSEFYMYLDYFHCHTDTYEPSFFGEELQFVENYWGERSATETSSTPPKN
ncbi:MAG: flagellar filament outer layer protein FlaA [Spirochaetota bacterium]|nr:flagellar filament outer layer protein FlaA [Spirochaetota bacterium]